MLLTLTLLLSLSLLAIGVSLGFFLRGLLVSGAMGTFGAILTGLAGLLFILAIKEALLDNLIPWKDEFVLKEKAKIAKAMEVIVYMAFIIGSGLSYISSKLFLSLLAIIPLVALIRAIISARRIRK